jgi:DNA-binding response OmpR family regulator
MYQDKSVFYIEDEDLISCLIVEELKEVGFDCTHAKEFSEASEKAAAKKYDIIISDLQIIKGSMDDIIDEIRKDESHVNHKTPVIITSAFVTDKVNERIGHVVQSILKKPHTIDAILDEIKKVMPS